MEHGPFDANNRADENIQQHNEIFTLLQGYSMNIVALQEEIESISKRFPRGMNVTDAQCARFTDPLSQLEQPVKDFHGLLELYATHPPLPSAIEQQRYSLIIILHDITKRTEDLKTRIHEYPTASQREAVEAVLVRREEILHLLEGLRDDLKELDQLLTGVFKQSTTQNQKEAEVADNATSQPRTEQQQRISHSPLPFAQRVTHFLQLTWSMMSSVWQPYSSKYGRTEIKAKDILGAPAASNTQSDPDLLRKILMDADNLEQKNICETLNFPFNELEGKSPAETADSLFRKMKARNRLPDLENVLRKDFSARFPDQ